MDSLRSSTGSKLCDARALSAWWNPEGQAICRPRKRNPGSGSTCTGSRRIARVCGAKRSIQTSAMGRLPLLSRGQFRPPSASRTGKARRGDARRPPRRRRRPPESRSEERPYIRYEGVADHSRAHRAYLCALRCRARSERPLRQELEADRGSSRACRARASRPPGSMSAWSKAAVMAAVILAEPGPGRRSLPSPGHDHARHGQLSLSRARGREARTVDERVVRDGHHPRARVAAWVAERGELLEEDRREACLGRELHHAAPRSSDSSGRTNPQGTQRLRCGDARRGGGPACRAFGLFERRERSATSTDTDSRSNFDGSYAARNSASPIARPGRLRVAMCCTPSMG